MHVCFYIIQGCLTNLRVNEGIYEKHVAFILIHRFHFTFMLTVYTLYITISCLLFVNVIKVTLLLFVYLI